MRNPSISEALEASRKGVDKGPTLSGSKKCVLMFSGGRDSTVAALKLAEEGYSLVLVTVTSAHLIWINQVTKRLEEIKHLLSADSVWLNVDQRQTYSENVLNPNTCLPCQRDYVSCGFAIARQLGVKSLAMGYTSYQSDWPEQTLDAVSRLKNILADNGISLMLPVYEIDSKEIIKGLLLAAGVSDNSLEQKCIKQVTNVELSQSELSRELDIWEKMLRQKLSPATNETFHTLQQFKIADL